MPAGLRQHIEWPLGGWTSVLAMSVSLAKETRRRALDSIRSYFTEQMDDDIGDLKAGLLLDFFLAEVGPSVYNSAIADAQAHLLGRVADLEEDAYQPEFTYWPR